MRKTFFRLLFLTAMIMLLMPSPAQAGNKYLWTFENFQAQAMGNGVLRFTLPAWVYGKGSNSTEYLEAHWDANDPLKDAYIFYSEVQGAGRGSGDVHRIMSFGADRGGNYDSRESGYGYVYALMHAGSGVVQNMYNGQPVTLTQDDRTHWCQNWLITARQNTSYVDHVVFLIIDWHMPPELQGKTFYVGLNTYTYYASDGSEDGRKIWDYWPGSYKGGDIPQSPQLFEPYFDQNVTSGQDIQGMAGVTYVTYQDPISYHTSLAPGNEIPVDQRSDVIKVKMTDQVQRINANFEVWTDTAAHIKQRLTSNYVDVPAYHAIREFAADGYKTHREDIDKWYIDYRYKQLTWKIYHPDEKDMITGDVFEIQRAYHSDFSDAETIQIISMEYDSTQIDTVADVQTYTYVDSVEAAWWNPVEKSFQIYYRIRRGSSSAWGWNANTYSAKIAYTPSQIYYPYPIAKASNNLRYRLADDFETSHKVHFTIPLFSQNGSGQRTAAQPGYSKYYLDPKEKIILRKILYEIGDTLDLEIPSDSVTKALNAVIYNADSAAYVSAEPTITYTDIATTPCVHYMYYVYPDTAGGIVQVPQSANVDYSIKKVDPVDPKDLLVYFTEAANINTFSATKLTYSDGVLLTWELTDGNVGYYTIETRPAGKDTAWTLLVDSLEVGWYKDRTANPYVSPEWEYRLTMTYECNGNTKSVSDSVVGSRNPYGKVSGYIRYEDGTACPNITVDAIRTSTGEKVQTIVTDENGYYLLDSLLYGEGYAYAITPTSQTAQFEYNHTSSGTATITLDLDDCIAENINFINISSVKLSGRVLYENTTIPARDVNFLLNGILVKNGTVPYKTDASGNFEFNVPKDSPFTIQAVKDGHWFGGDGYVRMLNDVTQEQDSVLTLSGRKDGVRIWDQTKVRLIGRLAGGRTQADKPLGFGLSRNNLGDDLQMVFELEGDNISRIVSIPEDQTIDHLDTLMRHNVRNGELLDSVGATFVEYQKKRIIIRPDVTTGEYEVDLFPVKYKITQATAKGYSTLFAEGKTSGTLDLTNAPLQKRTNTEGGKEVDYNESYSITYHSPIVITCTQLRYGMEVGYYGEETINRKNILNQNINVPIAQKQADGSYTYLFGAPVFNSDTYQFRVSAHEDYYYNNEPASPQHEEVRLQGGTLKVYNGMYDAANTEIQTKELDINGQADITVPINYVSFLKTDESALRVLDLSVEYEGAYVESQAIQAYVAGDKAKGQEFTASTHGKVVLLDILRDPPGSGSSAFIEAGTTYKYSYNLNLALTLGLNVEIGYGTSASYTMGTWAGVGGGAFVGTQTDINTIKTVGLPIAGKYVYKHNAVYTFSTTERIETGSDPMSVGPSADVYIGAVQNVYYGLMDAVQPLDSLTYTTLAARSANGTLRAVAEGTDANGQKYYLAIGTEFGAESYMDATFIYTQDYIEKTLLDQLKQRRDALLMTGDSATVAAIAQATHKPAYWSKVLPDDENFAQEGYYVMIRPDNDRVYDDEVASYNRQIFNWFKLLVDNETEKINALRGTKGKLVGTWSVGGSTKINHSESYEYSNAYTSQVFWPGSSGKLPTTDFVALIKYFGTTVADKLLSSFKKLQGGTDDTGDPTYMSPLDLQGKTPGAHWTLKITPILNVDYSYDPSSGDSHKRSTGFTLKADDWAYGHLDVSVYRVEDKRSGFNDDPDDTMDETDANDDYVYGSYVYYLNGGATRCPWEGPDSTRFYTPKVPLSAGTLKLENPKLDIDVHERSNVPVDQAAVFTLRLTNEGEVGYGAGNYAIPFTLKLAEGTNPKGARIVIDGVPLLEEGRVVRLTRGEIITKLVQVYAGEGYDFENITLSLVSPCMVNTKGQCTFSVHYMPVACPVSISAPHDKWIMNTLSPQDSAGWYLPVVIDGFDVNYKGFDHIEFQYKLATQSDEAWVNLCSYYANDSLYEMASGTKAMMNGGRIENIRFYGERDPMEQQYDLRAVAFCRHGNSYITRASAVLNGIKDTRPPRVFGEPEPANAILSVGENLVLHFNEAIAGNYLDEDNNFQVVGFTNETGITTGISLHFDETEASYAESKVMRSISDKSFTVDMLVKPTDPNAAAIFFNYDTKDGRAFAFGKTADNRLVATLGGKFIYSDTLPELMTAFNRVAVVYDRDQRMIHFYAGTKDVTLPSMKPFSSDIHIDGTAPICIGKGFQGNMMEVRLWTKALSGDEIVATNLKRLTGYERELVAYYPMNEGSGTTLIDKANGANLYTYGASWEHQKGISLRLKAGQKAKLNSDLLSRSNKQDETLMFWFKTMASQGTIFSAGRMDATHGTAIGFVNGVLMLNNYDQSWAISGNYADNAWHHFVLTINRAYNSVAVYMDDQLKQTFAATRMGEVSGTMYLGGNGFEGNLDEFIIFEQALPKALMQSYGTISPVGDEMGLMAYLPFQEVKENDNGILEQVFSVNDQRIVKVDGEVVKTVTPLILSVSEGKVSEMGDMTQTAPVQDIGQLTKMNFDWSFNNDELMINLNMPDREINKQTIYITVRDVEDLNGNPMASPVTWTTFVDRNAVKWAIKEIDTKAVYGEDESVTRTVRVINYSGKRHQYQIESLPDWLSIDAPSGTIEPTDVITLTLTFDANMAVGLYSDVLYLTDEDGLSEPLRVEYTVEAVCPWEKVDGSSFDNSMSLRGQVYIIHADGSGSYDTSTDDIIAAFCDGKMVGLANNTFDENTGKSFVYLTIYGNSSMVNGVLTFQLWQASTGHILSLRPATVQRFQINVMRGYAPNEPIRLTVNPEASVQKISLNPGWNWMSLNLKPVAADPNTLFSYEQGFRSGDIVKSPSGRQFSIFALTPTETAWYGTLNQMDYRQMYMVRVGQAMNVSVEGQTLGDDERTVTIYGNGWSSIAYLLDEPMSVKDAMADYFDHASEGDVIKSKDEVAVFSENKRWEGSLTNLRPGHGYLLRRLGQGNVTMHYYPQTSSNAPKRANSQELTTNDLFTNPNAASNMTMIAKLDNGQWTMDNGQLKVYVGDELAAVAMPIEVDGEMLYFLTIQSDQVGDLRFEMNGQELTPLSTEGASPLSNSPLNYIPDTHSGSLKAPVVLTTNDKLPTTYKFIENDHVVIIRNNEKYDVTGKKL